MALADEDSHTFKNKDYTARARRHRLLSRQPLKRWPLAVVSLPMGTHLR
jgi:hypothetical protein